MRAGDVASSTRQSGAPHSTQVRQRLTELGIDVILRQAEPEAEERDRLFGGDASARDPDALLADGSVVAGHDAHPRAARRRAGRAARGAAATARRRAPTPARRGAAPRPGSTRALRRLDLRPRALLRLLVGAQAQEARPVPEAVALELVVAHLADELRADRHPVELLARRPAALPARDAARPRARSRRRAAAGAAPAPSASPPGSRTRGRRARASRPCRGRGGASRCGRPPCPTSGSRR